VNVPRKVFFDLEFVVDSAITIKYGKLCLVNNEEGWMFL
jgi:hypothetical protein